MLSNPQRLILEAIVERIFPEDDFGPGGLALGAATYVERSAFTSEAFESTGLEDGLEAINRIALKNFGAPFWTLGGARQDALLLKIEAGAFEHEPQLRPLFAEIVERAKQGLFCDPSYGGNVDKRGWRLLGIPEYPNSRPDRPHDADE